MARALDPELLADDSLVRANTLLILISRTLNTMDKYIKSCQLTLDKKVHF